MLTKEVLACSLPLWIDKFKGITIPSIIIPLSESALNYFQENGTVVIPDDGMNNEHSNSSPLSNSVDSDELADEEIAEAPDLSILGKSIKDGIKKLGGSIFPKMNWSSPKDASWISYNNSLQCFTPSDIYLLLKSSTFVDHDLSCPFKDCDDCEQTNEDVSYCLVLRKWQEINPFNEFRCFVKNKQLVGISQRDISQFNPSIMKSKNDIEDDILTFWEDNIQNFFPLTSYVFDVHRCAPNQVTLLDFGPFGTTTDALLFSWDILLADNVIGGQHQLNLISNDDGCVDSNKIEYFDSCEMVNIEVEFRCIEHNTGIQPSDLKQYSLPIDVADLSRAVKLTEFMQMKINHEVEQNSSDEE